MGNDYLAPRCGLVQPTVIIRLCSQHRANRTVNTENTNIEKEFANDSFPVKMYHADCTEENSGPNLVQVCIWHMLPVEYLGKLLMSVVFLLEMREIGYWHNKTSRGI